MRNKKLPIDLDGLWENDNENFTVRYKDINPKQKQLLASKIKQYAQQNSIKKESGPTPILIQEALEEINPIIFSENRTDASWYSRGHRRFGKNDATYIAGYRFNKLCQAIYLLTCRKKGITPQQIKNIAHQTNPDWTQTEIYVNHRLNINPDNEEEYDNRITPIEDIGIEDIKNARIRTEQRRENRGNNPINTGRSIDGETIIGLRNVFTVRTQENQPTHIPLRMTWKETEEDENQTIRNEIEEETTQYLKRLKTKEIKHPLIYGGGGGGLKTPEIPDQNNY
jgi:hypothetical protein